jgi:hypothetical protein
MRMHEVKTDADSKMFLDVAVRIYKDDPKWIRPLDKDINDVFDTEKNKFFKRGNCTRWLLFGDDGAPIGRIAAFVNRQYKQDQPTGGIGFFECIESQAAANYMFDHCRTWLQQQGMEAMDGPINFGERDKWWGLVTDGFYSPLYGMTYNPPYYQNFFENYGFETYFQQLCFAMKVQDKLSDKFFERHAKISADKNFRAEHIRKSNITKYAADFTYVYNKAWAGHGGGKTLEEKQVQKMFATMKPVMDEKISWFAYYKDEPIAIWINLPDLNQYFKHLNGKFGMIEKLRFLYLQQFGACSRFVGLVFGIIPEYQGKGIDGYLIVEGAKVIQPMHKYTDYEMQ